MFSNLTKVLGAMTAVSGSATVVSGIHDYKIYKSGEIVDEEIGDIEEIQDIGANTADEIMNEV